ncbi:MAG TPA: alpha/beta hydrolase [Stellaceae bacterium]|nr:alpha/beta hydrolase [Stellaceae bacterium]
MSMTSENPDTPAVESLARDGGETVAYRRRRGKAPGVVFLGGFMSDMTGTKADALDRFCAGRGQAYVRFDYFGHGVSSGAFKDATVGRWKHDALAVLDELTEGPQVLVGSSIGGWIMLLAALARPQRIKALLGIAAAPDATEDLMWAELSEEQRATIRRDGFLRLPSEYSPEGYIYTRALIEDGRRHLVMREPIPLGCPVRLLHGLRDPDVPWRTSLALSEKLESPDVSVTLVKDGDHRLSTDADLALLMRTLEPLLTA